MLKIVIFDTGYGGEMFADRLESELPVAEIIRVIDWRNAETISRHPHGSRKIIEDALRPYLGTVDLIIIANYLISATSLNYLKRKYNTQKIIGFTLKPDRIVANRPTLIIATKPTTKNLAFFSLRHSLVSKTICLDTWPCLIDDGELTEEIYQKDLSSAVKQINNFSPKQIILACGQFTELTPKFRKTFGHNTRIVDSFDHTIKEAFRALSLSHPKT